MGGDGLLEEAYFKIVYFPQKLKQEKEITFSMT